ncbi:extensin [Sphingomonas koreensis]|nr:extensin [Sphingomonas koreensis]
MLTLVGCGSRREAPTTAHGRTMAYAPSKDETRQCYANLRRIGVAYNPLPDRERGRACSTIGTVQLLDVGVPTTNLGAMRCGLAEAYAGWVRNAVAPAAFQMLGSQLVKVETFGTYACRNTVGTASARLSGHAIANAVDVSAFDLADGRRISILGDWRSSSPQVRAFLSTIHSSACKRFGTVLSPDYNSAHRNHLHLEDDHASFCR